MWSFDTLAFTTPDPVDSLLSRSPLLAREWHESKNGARSPSDVHFGSPRKAWWRCAFGHEWFANIRDRVRKGAGCPFCAGKLASPTNCIAVASPRALELWHPTRNTTDNPYTVTRASNRKFWWMCAQGHEWKATVSNIVLAGSGCPKCVKCLDSSRERECRSVLEATTGFKFPKSRPLGC